MPNIDIAAAGRALLGQLVTMMTDAGVALPSRQGVLPGGLTAFDAEQFTVTWTNLGRGMPGAPVVTFQLASTFTFFYEFDVYLLRSTATVTGRGRQGGAPTPAQLESNFDQLADDAENLLASIVAIVSKGLLVDYNIPILFDGPQAVGPEGVLAGCKLTVQFMAGTNQRGGY